MSFFSFCECYKFNGQSNGTSLWFLLILGSGPITYWQCADNNQDMRAMREGVKCTTFVQCLLHALYTTRVHGIFTFSSLSVRFRKPRQENLVPHLIASDVI